MKQVCLLCEQDYLMRGVIPALNKKILICNECETLYLNENLDSDKSYSMRSYLESQGLEPTWDSIKIIEEIADI